MVLILVLPYERRLNLHCSDAPGSLLGTSSHQSGDTLSQCSLSNRDWSYHPLHFSQLVPKYRIDGLAELTVKIYLSVSGSGLEYVYVASLLVPFGFLKTTPESPGIHSKSALYSSQIHV